MLSKVVQQYCKGILALAVFLLSTNALAHGGVSIENDKCLFVAEGNLIHFTAYQPEFSGSEEFCRSIDSTVDTILVLDFVSEELRKLPVEVLLKKQNSEKDFVNHVGFDEKKYPSGTVLFNLKNVEEGLYRLHVNIGGLEPHEHIKGTHKSGFFEFSIKTFLANKDKNFIEKNEWLVYLGALGLLVYFLSVRFRS